MSPSVELRYVGFQTNGCTFSKSDRPIAVFSNFYRDWLRGGDLNPRPLGYEPNELPDCSTPRQREYHGDTSLRHLQIGRSAGCYRYVEVNSEFQVLVVTVWNA